MATDMNFGIQAKNIVDQNTKYVQRSQAADIQKVIDYLANYSISGNPMVGLTWTAPSTDVYFFDTIGGPIMNFNGTDATTLVGDTKRNFLRYLNKFVGQVLKNYNANYNL